MGIFFFCKQKTAYEMRISDWSSDVCSSDLDSDGYNPQTVVRSPEPLLSPSWSPDGRKLAYVSSEKGNSSIYIQDITTGSRTADRQLSAQIGRASCRERVCQYV